MPDLKFTQELAFVVGVLIVTSVTAYRCLYEILKGALFIATLTALIYLIGGSLDMKDVQASLRTVQQFYEQFVHPQLAAWWATLFSPRPL